MFQLLPCSVCQRTFSLRKDVPEDALLKCPNCGNQFRLGDVLDAFYGPWIVLGDAPTNVQPEVHALASRAGLERPINAPTEARLSFDNLLDTHHDSVEAALNEHALRENALTDDASEVAADNVFESTDLQLPESAEADELGLDDDGSDLVLEESPRNDEPFAIGTDQIESPMEAYETPKPAVKKLRPRRGDKGGLWSILQVVLGGAAAIPVTLLLLWYVAGKDVMNAGPTIAQYAPWIVPQKLRSPREILPAAQNSPRVPPPALGEGGFRNFDEELSKPDDSTANADNPPAPPEETKVAAEPPARGNKPAVPIDGSGMASTFEIVRLAKEKIATWDPKSPDQLTRATDLFKDLVRLSELLTNFPSNTGAMTLLNNDLNDIGRAFKDNKELRLALLNFQADQFNGKSLPTSPGRLYLGRASEVTETDEQWIIVSKDGNPHLKFEIPKKAVTNLQSGQVFFCLGIANDDSRSQPAGGAPTILSISASYLQAF